VALVVAGHREGFEEELADPAVLEGVSRDPEGASALSWCREQLASA
jgi:hypothetical protein